MLPDRQLYHCFGCGKGGRVISFVMEVENLPFLDALRLLAKRAGMEFPEGDMDEGSRRKRSRLLSLNKEAARFSTASFTVLWGRRGWITSAAGGCPRDYDPVRPGLCPGELGQPDQGHGPEGL